MAGKRKKPKSEKSEKRVTRYTYEHIKEPRTPETGHTSLLPADEQVVTLPMDNGWTKAIRVGRLPGDDQRPVVLDMDPATDPVLFWSGKRSKREVPILPLQRSEVVSESRIAQIIERARRASDEGSALSHQGQLFADLERTLRQSERNRRVEFYTYDEGWKNKLICGDSLQVAESLLHYEGLRGKVQTIYFDPPYGVSYNTNFQQRVDTTKNEDADRSDDVLTIKAFRDTWALGIHSYLSYLTERLYLFRELLHDRGSVFVQISDTNFHVVRAVLDEVFGASNFVAPIAFSKTTSQSSGFLPSVSDFLLWYVKDRAASPKYLQLYLEKSQGSAGSEHYDWVELPDGTRRRLTSEEEEGESPLPAGSRLFTPGDMCSTRSAREHERWPIVVAGREYWPTGSSTWKTNKEGIERLREANRLIVVGNTLRYVRYLDDFGAYPLTSTWLDTGVAGFAGSREYVVWTNPKVITRCIAMTTEPGDLVFDPTCGSGTTAYCAERLGRRWITCDTSRVAMNVARRRLLSAVFPHFVLKDGRVASGFRYEELRRTTMGTFTGEKEPATVSLVDKPLIDNGATRVCGPFEVLGMGRYSVEDWKGYVVREASPGYGEPTKLQNYVEVICRLYRHDAAIEGAAGQVHAVVESEQARIALSVGPLSGRVTAKQISDAVQDALAMGILEVHVLGWAFEANVGEVKSQLESRGKIKIVLIMIRPDTLAEGMKVTQPDMLFSPLALPDIEVDITKTRKGPHEMRVRLKGVALFDRKRKTTEYKAADSGYVSAWYLDEDYDGDCFIDCQMFFDFRKAPNIKAALKAEIDPAEFKLQLTSEPFGLRTYKRIAVKVVDVYGNESTVVRDLA